MEIVNVIKNIIYDLDGTIVDSAHQIYSVLIQIVSECDLSFCDYNKFKSLIGRPIYQILIEDFSYDPDLAFDISNKFRNRYSAKNFRRQPIFDGIVEQIKYFDDNGLNQFVVTNKGQETAEAILDDLKLSKFFTEIKGSKTIGVSNKSERVSELISRWKLCKDETLIFGDTHDDFKAAQFNGLLFVLAEYGYGDLYDSDKSEIRSVHSAAELHQIVPIHAE